MPKCACVRKRLSRLTQVTCVSYVYYITTAGKKNDMMHDHMMKYKASSPASGLDSLKTDVKGSI